jgi:hypothetical protein
VTAKQAQTEVRHVLDGAYCSRKQRAASGCFSVIQNTPWQTFFSDTDFTK